MNILLLTQTFPLNPKHHNAHFLYDFVEGLVSVGHKVTVVLPFHEDLKPQMFKEIEVIPFRYIWPDSFHLIGYGRTLHNNRYIRLSIYPLTLFYLFFLTIKLLILVRRKKIDVINAHWLIPNGFVGALVSKLTNIPLVISLAGTDVYISQTNFIAKYMAKFAISTAKKTISNSPQLLADLQIGGEVISYPVPQNTGKRRKNKHLVVAGAGRLVWHKGLNFLKEVEPKAEIISGLSIDEFRSKLLSVDIFVAPSLRDPSGNLDDANTVVLQAMAAGCAVIATDFPGYRKMISNGRSGILFPEGDKKKLEKAIQLLKHSKKYRQKLGKAAQQTIQDKFTPSKIAQKYLKIFRERQPKEIKKIGLGNDFYSNAHPIMYNKESRKRVAIQTYKVLLDFFKQKDLRDFFCLDIGCSTGIITYDLAPHFKRIIGVDLDKDAISSALKKYKRNNLTFLVANGENLKFSSNSFDTVVCQEVYENANNPDKLLHEIYRVLKPKGICYFAADNLLFPIESQYKIPLLLYLPDSIAKILLKFLGYKRFYLGHFKTYWELKKLCKEFIIHDYTLEILCNPQKYNFTRLYKYKKLVDFLPSFTLKILYFFVPTFIWVLEKPKKVMA